MLRSDNVLRLFVVVGLSFFASGCGDPAGMPAAELPALSLVGTSTPLPPSQNDGVALITERRACTIDSYLTQVVCAEPNTAGFETFGREGEGPGEFLRVSSLIRGADGTIVVRDARQGRLSVVLRDGAIHHLFRIPPTWREIRADSFPITGYVSQPSVTPRHFEVAVVDLDHSGAMVGNPVNLRIESADPLPPGAPVPALVRSQTGEFVAWSGGYNLHRFDQVGRFVGAFTASDYQPERPNARDREVNAETFRVLFGADMPPAQADDFAARPKVPLLPGDPLRFDSHARLWVATTVGRDTVSHLDVFDGSRHMGTVTVRGRMLAFDILGATLVVLAERGALGGDGPWRRELDWYRIID